MDIFWVNPKSPLLHFSRRIIFCQSASQDISYFLLDLSEKMTTKESK